MQYCKIIKIKNDVYLYDAIRNKIALIDDKLCELLEKDSLKSEEQKFYNEMLDKYKIRDVRVPYNTCFIPIIDDNEMFDIYNNNVSQITLSLTENCNMRCDYCYYHDKYNHNMIREEMSFDTIKKSIDFLFENSQNKKNVIIAFYGGEPLLCYDKIRSAVKYVNEKKIITQKVSFLMTTNGVLLKNKDICDFIVANEFHLTISLDGPKIIHDNFRKDINSDGTYDSVITGLKYLKDKHSDYLYSYMRVNSVNPYSEIPKQLYDYFINNHIDNNFSSITKTNHFEQIMKNRKSFDEKYSDITYNKFNMFDDEKISEKYAKNKYQSFIKMKESKDLCNYKIGGCCLPGLDRLFIKSNGNMYPCEKVNENDEKYIIGNVRNGFNFASISNLIKSQNNTVKAKCQSCWAFRICTSCFEVFNFDENVCDNVRNNIQSDLENYIEHMLYNERYIV